jgi:intracellular sulfur oxidation DsrE/DsrF family protein
MLSSLRSSLLIVLLLVTPGLQASSQAEVNKILAQPSSPPGVVFEIVSGKADALRWALPAVNAYIKQLHSRFPELDIAVVSHGDEQFALMADKQKEYQTEHNTVRSLTGKQGVSVHVCATYASWRNIDPEAFPDYVHVAEAGPAKINDYKNLGYIHILVKP